MIERQADRLRVAAPMVTTLPPVVICSSSPAAISPPAVTGTTAPGVAMMVTFLPWAASMHATPKPRTPAPAGDTTTLPPFTSADRPAEAASFGSEIATNRLPVTASSAVAVMRLPGS